MTLRGQDFGFESTMFEEQFTSSDDISGSCAFATSRLCDMTISMESTFELPYESEGSTLTLAGTQYEFCGTEGAATLRENIVLEDRTTYIYLVFERR